MATTTTTDKTKATRESKRVRPAVESTPDVAAVDSFGDAIRTPTGVRAKAVLLNPERKRRKPRSRTVTPKCPECESLDTRSDGYRRDQAAALCLHCGRQFVIEPRKRGRKATNLKRKKKKA